MHRSTKQFLTFLLAPALALSAAAQAPATPATTPAKPATTAAAPAKATPAAKPAMAAPAAKPATAATQAKPGTAAAKKTATGGPKLPPGLAPVKGSVQTVLALQYQDIFVGSGPLPEAGKEWSMTYAGYLAKDGTKFDSSADHDFKPLKFVQGAGRMIPGFDAAVKGMRPGGKRRIFIPSQLAYGPRGGGKVIPPDSDLIFDVELVSVEDAPKPPTPPQHPGAPGGPGAHGAVGAPGATAPGAHGIVGAPGATAPGTDAKPATAPAPASAPAAATPAKPATPATPAAAAPAKPATPAPATTPQSK